MKEKEKKKKTTGEQENFWKRSSIAEISSKVKLPRLSPCKILGTTLNINTGGTKTRRPKTGKMFTKH